MQGNCSASGTSSVDASHMVYMPARSSSESEYSGSCCDRAPTDFPYDESTLIPALRSLLTTGVGNRITTAVFGSTQVAI